MQLTGLDWNPSGDTSWLAGCQPPGVTASSSLKKYTPDGTDLGQSVLEPANCGSQPSGPLI